MNYQIQVSLNPEFTDIVVNKVVSSVTEYELKKDLDYFTVYYWRVKAINPLTGAQSEWSQYCAFRVRAEDVILTHNVADSYLVYGSEYFCLEHKFVTDYDTECVIPDAVIGAGLCPPTSGVAEIGVVCLDGDRVNYCTGVCVPEWKDIPIYLLGEDGDVLLTEDGEGIAIGY